MLERSQLYNDLVTKEIQVKFHTAVRGKNMEDEEWTLIQDMEDIEIEIYCNLKREACNIF